MINSSNKIQKVLFLLLLIIFFNLNLKNIDYGLPFFFNDDEVAFMISSLSFLSPITKIEFNLIDPVIAPLLNIILILKIVCINDLIINSLSFSEIKNKIYLNPEMIIHYGRLSSLIITTLSLSVLFLIFKKLKINYFIYFPIFISIIFSLFATNIANINGKNSYYLFFFLIQIYFLIKYLIKIEKFNFKSYILFSILASSAWGVNYWSSIISIYAVLVLHYQKYRFKNFEFLIYFGLIFLILGIIPSYLFSSDIIFGHIFSKSSPQYFSIKDFILLFSNKLILSFKIILNTEIIFFIFGFLALFYLFKNFQNKKNFIIILILFFEPIILFSFTSNVTPELRYLSGSICSMFILLAIILNDFLKENDSKKIVIIFLLINFTIAFNKLLILNNINNIIANGHSFYHFFNSNKSLNDSILYVTPDMSHRKNVDNLLFYKILHEKNFIKNKRFEKDNYDATINKINKLKEDKNKIILNEELKKNLNIFTEQLFVINDIYKFFDEVKLKYKYIAIQENNYNSKITSFVKKNFNQKKILYKKNSELIFNNRLRDIIEYVKHGGEMKNFSQRIVLGNNYSLYELN